MQILFKKKEHRKGELMTYYEYIDGRLLNLVSVLTIEGETPSKKNSRINTRSGRSFPNKNYVEWQKRAIKHIQIMDFKPCKTEGLKIRMTFTHGDKRRRDSDNAVSSILDMLVKSGILQDDNWQIVKYLEVINEYEKEAPRCRIEIYEGEET